MKRTLKDTRRDVSIVIDNQDRGETDAEPWAANATVDGDPALEGNAYFGPTPDKVFTEITQALEQSGELDDLPEPMPDSEVLRSLIAGIVESWSGGELPDWRDNEYMRGQCELVLNSTLVLLAGEEEADSEMLMDRVWTWVRHDAANTTAEPVMVGTPLLLSKHDGVVTVTEVPQVVPVRFKVGTDIRSWVEFELADATEQELATLEQEDEDSVALVRALDADGRLVEHGTESDDNPDYFFEQANPAVIEVEVVSPTGMEEG